MPQAKITKNQLQLSFVSEKVKRKALNEIFILNLLH